MSYSSSRAITNSTMSRESAPRSSMKDASGVTSSSLTPSCSQMISFTFCSTVDAAITLLLASAPTRASHVQAAVDVQDVPRDVAGSRRRQEGHRGGDLLGTGDPSRRNHVGVEGPLGLAEGRG